MNFNNLNITGLTMRNFLSIGNVTQTMRFDQHGMTLVLGHNGDSSNNSARNGAGKSAVLQALSFALYGKPLTKIKIPNLVNNINQKGMYVSVDFSKGGKDYRIERGRNPTVMKFYVNGENVSEDNDAKGENAETQIDINRIVGMSHTMFKHIVALNTYTEPFLKESDAKQREIIEELLGITQMSEKAERLKAKITLSKDRIKSLEAHVSAIRATNARIELSIETARKNAGAWETKREKEISDLRSQYQLANSVDLDAELKIFDQIDHYDSEMRKLKEEKARIEESIRNDNVILRDIEASISRETSVLNRSDDPAVGRIDKEIARTQDRIKVLREEQTRHIESVAHFQNMLNNPDEHDCRTCGQKLEGTDHLAYVIGRFEEELKNSDEKLTRTVNEIMELGQHIDDLERDREDVIRTGIKARNDAEEALVGLDTRKSSVVQQIALNTQSVGQNDVLIRDLNGRPESVFETREQIYELRYQITSLESDIVRLENDDNPHVEQINGFRNAIQVVDLKEIDDATVTLRHQEFLFKLLTSKDSFIRRAIIEQNLAFLNERFNHYLGKLGLPHEVTFHSDLNVDISLLGRDFDFAQLSRGESGRVIMATSWAFRDVWESLNNSINIMWVDELIDSGLCPSGAEDALQILKGFARNGRNIFLISHREELIGRIDTTLYVEKMNGFTQLREEHAE